MKLYHISDRESLDELIPSIPRNYFTRNGIEDSIRPRICCSIDIDGCLTGIGYNIEGKEFNVYEIDIDERDIYKPSRPELPDSEWSGELWIFKVVKCQKIARIRVTRGISTQDYTYWIDGIEHKGELVRWEWEVIDE